LISFRHPNSEQVEAMERHACPTCGSPVELALAQEGVAPNQCPWCGESLNPEASPGGMVFLGAILMGSVVGLLAAALLLLSRG
jgi:hypothetical protein